MIHVIGDSHVVVFSGFEVPYQNIDHTGFLPFFRAYRLGPYTAYNAAKRREVIEPVLERWVGPGDYVMLCFGEIDCRVHLAKQSEVQGRSLEDIIEECVDRYAQIFDIKERYGIRLLVWNVIPSSLKDIDSGEYSTYGTCRERNEVVRLFNRKLSEECKKREIAFVSVFDRLVDENGLTRSEYYADDIHLSQRAMPFILDSFREQMLLDVPLKAAAHTREDDISLQATDTKESSEGKRTLVWCGISELAKFVAMRPRFDLCYVIDAEEARLRAAESIFGKDPGVRMFHMGSVNLLDFCRRHGIERIDTLALHTGANDLSIVKTAERLLKKKRVSRLECEVSADRIKTFATLCGDAYDVRPASPESVGKGFRRIQSVLKEDSRSTRRAGGEGPLLFNVVHSHLGDEETQAMHCGTVSLVWSRLPLEACDLYLYVDACSFVGRRNGLNVLLLQEPPTVLPGQYDEAIWNNFDHIITNCDRIVERRENRTKALLPRSVIPKFVKDDDIEENNKERQRKYPLAGRNPGICMIAGNRESRLNGELQSKRAQAALWFYEHSAIPFDVFGDPPFSLPNYKGILPQDRKMATLSLYRYNLCFEDLHHPVLSSGIVDEILSCLETRTVPIYLGADNIDTYVPRECFIDFRSFRDYGELDRFLASMSDEQYYGCVAAIDNFVVNGGLLPYGRNTLYDQLIQIYATYHDKNIESLRGRDGQWAEGTAEGTVVQASGTTRDRPLWLFDQLAQCAGEGAIMKEGGISMPTEMQGDILNQSVDRMARTAGREAQFDLQTELEQAGRIVESGFVDINDLYRYAQLLILAERFDESVLVLNRVISTFPNHTHALNDLAVIHFRKNDFDTAFSFWQRALRADPTNHNALRNLLALMNSTGRQKSEMMVIVRDLLPGAGHSTETTAVLKEFGLAETPADPFLTVTPTRPLRIEESIVAEDTLNCILRSGLWKEGEPLRLHLGCGENHFEGYVNVDYPPSEHTVQTRIAADVFADIAKLDLPECTVDEVRLHHVFEHFNRSSALALLIRWHRWLKTGGALYIETPDLMGNAKLLLSDASWKTKMAAVRHLAGSHEASWAYHIDHWFPERFAHTLEKLGFERIVTKSVSWPQEPCLANVHAAAAKARHVPIAELLEAADGILWESTVAPTETAMYEVWRRELREKVGPGSGKPTGFASNAGLTLHKPGLDWKGEDLQRVQVHVDSPGFDGMGYDEADMTKNGEIYLFSRLIQDGGIVFDVGANKGLWSNRALSLFGHVSLFAFEPVPETFDTLRESLGRDDGRICAVNAAVSNEDTQKAFFHYTNNATVAEMSTFYRRIGVEKQLGLQPRPITVEAVRLDTFCRKHSVDHIDYLKIDTEGGEYDVLKGAEGLLREKRIKFIQFEYGGTYSDAKTRLSQVCELLSSFGYSLFRILPEGLLHIARWRNELENYRMSNYLAALSSSDSVWKPMEMVQDRKTAVVVFSKDRAMQLDCTLRTLHLHCRDLDQASVKVLYMASSYFYERGYQKLKEEFPSVHFAKEKAFKNDLLSFVSSWEHILFLVDDNIFVRDFRLGDVMKALADNPSAIGYSLRLGRNTTSSYMLGRSQSLPGFISAGNGGLSFDWAASELDFGYPLEVSSSLYRVPDILPLLNGLDYRNPNTLEALLDANKTVLQRALPRLLCYETSVTFCNPANKVQDICAGNRAGTDSRYSPVSLQNAFLKGYRLDGERCADFIPNACHQEVEVGFVRKGANGLADGCVPWEDRPAVSIAIPNYNGLNHIKICLESIRRNTPEDHELIVIDNGSTDGSLEYLHTVPGIILIENPANVGAPGARNQALSIARGDYVVFMDNDTIVTKDWLSRFIDHADRNPNVGIIGACTSYATGPQRVEDADRLSYTTIDGLEAYAAKRADEHRNELIRSPRLISFCIFFRKEVMERIGGMDTSFSKFCYEDDDYSIRATIAGLTSVVALDVFIHHTGGPQGRGDKEYNAWLAQAWEGFRRKWRIDESNGSGQYDPASLAARPYVRSEHYVPLPDRQVVESLIYGAHRGNGGASGPADIAEEHFKKALAYEDEGNIDLSMEELGRVLAIDDRHAGACNGIGVLHYRRREMSKALQMLAKAVMLQPDNIGYLKNLAVVALELGETEDAIGLYKQILALDPADVETLLVVGHLCEQCGQAENALGFLQRILDKEPNNAHAIEAVGRIRKLTTGVQEGAPAERGQGSETAVVGG